MIYIRDYSHKDGPVMDDEEEAEQQSLQCNLKCIFIGTMYYIDLSMSVELLIHSFLCLPYNRGVFSKFFNLFILLSECFIQCRAG